MIAMPTDTGPVLLLGMGVFAATLLGGPRATAAEAMEPDTLVLNTGETLKGSVLDQRFTLRTPYGGLTLERNVISAINFAGDTHGLHTLTTVNSNRFTGFIEESQISFQAQAGSRNQVRREKLSELKLGERAAGVPGHAASTWVRLKTGDVLSGRVRPDPLPLLITNVQVDISLKEVSAFVLTTNYTTPPRLFLRNGKVLEAGLWAEYVNIELDAGPKVELYGLTIATLCDSAALAAVSGGRLRAGPSGAVVTPEPFGLSGSTNLEGLIWIPPGQFLMGSPYNEVGRDVDEGPQRQVVIPQGFWIGKCEVTQAEYEKVIGTNPSNSNQDSNLPVEKVNWFEAMEYCAKLTGLGETAGWLPKGYAFRLPTEAEWEYCCRAESTTPYTCGDDGSELQLGQYAWFTRNSDFGSKPVGTKKPNAWGLHDMHGNVWEWCLDRLDLGASRGSITNTPVAATGGLRVARGGSWLYDAKACRSANRDDYSPGNRCSDIGFRVVLAPR